MITDIDTASFFFVNISCHSKDESSSYSKGLCTSLEFTRILVLCILHAFVVCICVNPLPSLAAKEPSPITVTLPDGKEVQGQAWRTTPYELIASSVR